MTSTFNVADAVVRRLLDHGVDTIFALPGVQNDHLFDAIARTKGRLRVIHTRHEQGAAYMALGAAMATGKPAAFCVVPGPGILNATAAMCTAYACNAPLIALTGQIPSKLIGRGLGILHELPDQLGVLQLLTKSASRIEGANDAAQRIDEAFHIAASGRPGPVSVEAPIDVWPLSASHLKLPPIAPASPAPLADVEHLDRALTLLRDAQRPVIIVGGGAQHAADEVRALSEALQAPVVAHRMGHGIVDGRSPLSATIVDGARHWANADVVLAIGTRLQFQQMTWGVDDDLKIIRIDIDPKQVDRIRAPAVALVGDAKAETARLLAGLSPEAHADDRGASIRAEKVRAGAAIAYLEPQLSLLGAIRRALPENGVLVDELTQLGYVARLAFPTYHPRSFLSPGYQGTLGWGLPTAMGVKVARPEAPVVLISGDGGLMFNIQELATAVQHRIPVAVVLANDGAFGNVLRTQQEDFAGREIASRLQNPDFIELARAFGCLAARVEDAAGLEDALRASFNASLPTLIEIKVGAMPSPWPLLRSSKKR